MDNIIGVLQMLGDGVTETPMEAEDEHQFEARFRTLISNLLHSYFQLPGKEREMAASMQIICRTARRFPGTFHNGKAHGVLPLLAWIIPFFAEQTLASRHDLIFETASTLLFLFSTGDCLLYRQFLLDVMLMVEDLLSIATFYATESAITVSTALSLVCLRKSYVEIEKDGTAQLIVALPLWSKPPDGPGILVDLTGFSRWQLFAHWMLNLLSRCIAETRLQVEGLITRSFMSACCSLIAYGEASLQKVCFEFIHIASSSLDVEVIPIESILHSIASILSQSGETVFPFRTETYDSAIGGCLDTLYSISPENIVEQTAQEMVGVFVQTFQTTHSQDLKAAICSACMRIVKTCPTYAWQLDCLVSMLYCSEPCSQLVSCFEHVVSALGLETVGGQLASQQLSRDAEVSSKKESENSVLLLRNKRIRQDDKELHSKRLKACEDETLKFEVNNSDNTFCQQHLITDVSGKLQQNNSEFSLLEGEDSSAVYLHQFVLHVVNSLDQSHEKEGVKYHLLTAASILCQVFAKFPKTLCYMRISQKVLALLSWVAEQGQEGNLKIFQLSVFLNAIYKILQMQSFSAKEGSSMILSFSDLGGNDQVLSTESFVLLLKLPWLLLPVEMHIHIVQKTKCRAVSLLSKLGTQLPLESILDILDMALQDTHDNVRIESIASMPIIALTAGYNMIPFILKRFEAFGLDRSEKIRQIVSHGIGFMACICGSFLETESLANCLCCISSNASMEADTEIMSTLLSEFHCSCCDNNCAERYVNNVTVGSSCRTAVTAESDGISDLLCALNLCQSIFQELLFNESSEEVQVATVGSISRLLRHSVRSGARENKSLWIKCLECLPVYEKKAVRRAFSLQIHCFIDEPVMEFLFDDDKTCTRIKEEKMLGLLKHSMVATNDPDVTETLLETVAQVMKVADINSNLFFFSFALLIDQLDNPKLWLRVMASRLIKFAAGFHHKGGVKLILSKFTGIRDELFEYLKSKLVVHPLIISEFAESVLNISVMDLIHQMIPIILPKLVVSQQKDVHAMATLQELAKLLNKNLPVLLLEWCHKVLSYAILHSDAQEVLAVTQFYEAQTGSNTREIFTAIVPVLLEEFVPLMGYSNKDNTNERLLRIPETIQRVAYFVTGSEDLPSFLKNYFVGLLNCIDTKMLRVEDQSLQNQGLRCLEKLIELIGSHLSAFVPKIMVLLMHAIEKEYLQHDGLHVWLLFVKRLAEVSPSSLKHVAPQIVSALMPCLEKEQNQLSDTSKHLVDVLEELILKNKQLLEEKLVDLPMLPSFPKLDDVNELLERSHSSLSLRQKLQKSANGLNHVSLGVRYTTVMELTKLLKENKKDVSVMIISDVSLDSDIIRLLITNLLRGCTEESRTMVGQKLKLACAQCLGALGAVDPLKFQGTICHRFKIECSDDDLIFELIHEHLARVFRAASDTIVQDSAALAIQELLKLSGCQASLDYVTSSKHDKRKTSAECRNPSISPGSANLVRGERLWSRFSDYIKDIIAPCLTSKFHLQNVVLTSSGGAIYRPSMSFRRWIYSWIRKLTSQANGTRADIFNACRGIARHDMGTALYLLPYLVLNVVCYGTCEERESVTEEILSVLAEAASHNKAEALKITNNVTAGGSDSGGAGQNDLCIQAIFTLFDNLGQWADDLRQKIVLSQSLGTALNSKSKPQVESQAEIDQLRVQCNHVSELIKAIPKVTLAEASFRCQAYARSLLYFETHVRNKAGSFNPAAFSNGAFEDADVSFLMEIYSGLDEPDGLFGLARLRTTANLQDQILINEKAGNWAEALACSEQALQMEPASIERHTGVLNCLLNMCHLQAMVTHVDGLISRFPQHKRDWCMSGVQAAWRLGRWELMDEYLSFADKERIPSSSSEFSASFDMNLAKCLQALQKKDDFAFQERLASTRQGLLAPLAAAGMESYTRAYPFVVKLHMLKELEDFHGIISEEPFLTEDSTNISNPSIGTLIGQWNDRLKFMQPSLWAREPVLALRKLLLSYIDLHSEASNCWLQYAKLCRASGHYEIASRAILQVQSSGVSNVHIELAKLLWDAGKSDRAIAELQQSLVNIPIEELGSAANAVRDDLLFIPSTGQPIILATQARVNRKSDTAKTLLLLARWVHYTGKKQREDVIKIYVRVKELSPTWEKSFFFMAKYHDDLVADIRKRQEITEKSHAGEKPWWSSLSEVLLYYAKGLHRGHTRLYQALPRLLTLWFQFGNMYVEEQSPSIDLKKTHTKVMSIMRGCVKDLPTYQWLTAFSQLVSRICHQNEEVVQLVKQILVIVLQAYPQQGLWKMAAVSRSAVSARRQAAAEVIQAARKAFRQDKSASDLFTQFSNLIDHLIKLCFRDVDSKSRTINISSDFASLKRMMPVGVLMPIQQALTVSLPADGVSDKSYDPFSSGNYATISGIGDEVEVLASLQHPKKIVLHGSDGISRLFLCKPKDDLRKDARMMEFTTMINLLLSKDPKCRRRNLYIRTFAVIPFKEDCGMVEWVLHTRGLRHILQDLYIACGKFDKQKTHQTIKQLYDTHEKCQQEVQMFKTKILPMFPPVFHKWFLNTFSEPASWFRARVSYARTTAVWSMVGHIVGLGDRHGENILFDSTTGDCVHVDFSCLFDKGLQLQKPELVPFRLTQNMIDGLGITGYEGIFLRVCEMTLSVLRTHRETLMSVLEAFIHDPLLEWTKSNTYSGEVNNPHAQKAISNIEARLRGVVVGVGAAPSLPLSVEGQARRLIAEAVSHDNLGKMYIWWMPWF